MQGIRIIEIPACKMISSGRGMFGEEKFDGFLTWLDKQPRGVFPKDFLAGDDGLLHWLYLCEEGMQAPEGYDVIDFKGGLYAVATDVDQKTDLEAMNAAVDVFLSENGLERDGSRWQLGNIVTSPAAREVLGYEQMDYYFPVRAKV